MPKITKIETIRNPKYAKILWTVVYDESGEFGIGETSWGPDTVETFLTEIGCYETHTCNVDAMILKVLEKGECSDRLDTLPSHYTMIHYIDVDDKDSSDVFHHPCRSILNALRPAAIDEWKDAAGLYINKGDVIIFPSFIEHSTPPVKSKNRVTMTLPLVLEMNE